jgi:1-deoxyxylulose-5-phosphate synthase
MRVSMQNHYNLVYRAEEREMIPQCINQGVAVLPAEPAGPWDARRQQDARVRETDDPRQDR